jgi:hypothetical protein
LTWRIKPTVPAIDDPAQPAAVVTDSSVLVFVVSAEARRQPITPEDLQRLGTLREANIRGFIHKHRGINLVRQFSAFFENPLRNRLVGFWIYHKEVTAKRRRHVVGGRDFDYLLSVQLSKAHSDRIIDPRIVAIEDLGDEDSPVLAVKQKRVCAVVAGLVARVRKERQPKLVTAQKAGA